MALGADPRPSSEPHKGFWHVGGCLAVTWRFSKGPILDAPKFSGSGRGGHGSWAGYRALQEFVPLADVLGIGLYYLINFLSSCILHTFYSTYLLALVKIYSDVVCVVVQLRAAFSLIQESKDEATSDEKIW